MSTKDMDNKNKLYEFARLNKVNDVLAILKTCPLKQAEIDAAFSIACINGNYDVVKGMLFFDDKEKRPMFTSTSPSDLSSSIHGFYKACQKDYLNIVDLILNNPDLDNRPNLDSSGITALRCAASSGSMCVIKYMLELPEIRKQFTQFHNDASVFYTALVNLQDEVLRYMIFDLSFERSAEVSHMISELWDSNYSNFVNSLFGIKKSKDDLDKNLSVNKNHKLKLKHYWKT